MEKQTKQIMIAVSGKKFREVQTATRFDLPLKKALKLFPNASWQEVGENTIMLLNAPKHILFRRRWTKEIFPKQVRMVEADRTTRYFERLTFYF